MPSTVAELFAAAGLTPAGVVGWGARVPELAPGNYVVALTDDIYARRAGAAAAPLDHERLTHLLDVRPELLLDGSRPTVAELAARLDAFWLPDEVAVYIGLAGTSLRRRIGQYYTTPLGAKRPHAGGWWLKTLSVLDELWVHYAATPDNATAETRMLQHFAGAMGTSARETLPDRVNVSPFANLRTGTGVVKKHGITGATGALDSDEKAAGTSRAPATDSAPISQTTRPPARAADDEKASLQAKLAGGHGGTARSQRVTARDLVAGQVRFPRPAKRLFPDERDYLDVDVRGSVMRARWDPRDGPDKERSGMLSFGKGKLDGLIDTDEVLAVTSAGPGTRVELR